MAFERISPPSALLLLPPPPSFDFIQVKDAFEPSVSDVSGKLSDILNGTNRIAFLDIALAVPEILSPANRPRARVFKQLQHYLTSVYTLIGAVSAARNIELDSPGGIDARVIFVDDSQASTSHISATRSQWGPTLDLQSLATSRRQWDHVFHPDSQAGKTLANSFVSMSGQSKGATRSIIQAVSSGPEWTVPTRLLIPEQEEQPVAADVSTPENQRLSTPHYSVAVGGTFDHLHLGHKLLLTATALALEPLEQADPNQERVLIIGVTGDTLLVNKKYAEFLESWDERYQSTASFFSAIMDPSEKNAPRIQRTSGTGPNEKSVVVRINPKLVLKFVEILDPFGPTITEESISALVVSEETHSGGAAVNDKRKEKGWDVLAVFEVDVLQSGQTADASSLDTKISSTEIRRRRMNLARV